MAAAAPEDARLHAAQMLGTALADSDCPLRYLDLSHNELTGVGAGAIALALSTNKALISLDLSFNAFGGGLCPIGGGGGGAASAGGGKSRSNPARLAKFGDPKNGYGSEFGRVYCAATLLGRSLARNTTLQTILLVKNKISAIASVVIANALYVHPQLRCVDMSSNPLGIVGVRTLLRALATKRMAAFDSLWAEIDSDASSAMSEEYCSSDEELFESAAVAVAEKVCHAL